MSPCPPRHFTPPSRFPDVPEEIVLQVWEASGENLEEAAAGLWFMKILQAFMMAGATTVPLPEVPLEDMSIRELMAEVMFVSHPMGTPQTTTHGPHTDPTPAPTPTSH